MLKDQIIIIPSMDECKHCFVDSYKGKPGSYPDYTIIENINNIPAFRVIIKEVDCKICGFHTVVEISRQKISYNDPVAKDARYKIKEAQQNRRIKIICAIITITSFGLMLFSLSTPSLICISIILALISGISWFITMQYMNMDVGGWSGYI